MQSLHVPNFLIYYDILFKTITGCFHYVFWSALGKIVLSHLKKCTGLFFRVSRRWTVEVILLLGQQLILSSTEELQIKLFYFGMQKTYPKSSIKPIYFLPFQWFPMILAHKMSFTYLSTKSNNTEFMILLRQSTRHIKQTGHINKNHINKNHINKNINLCSVFKNKENYNILLKFSQNLFSFASISKLRQTKLHHGNMLQVRMLTVFLFSASFSA